MVGTLLIPIVAATMGRVKEVGDGRGGERRKLYSCPFFFIMAYLQFYIVSSDIYQS